jgi:GNAT superfamily N-acetyltransferase
VIRAARPDDVARLQEIEVAAGELFRTIGMDRIADDDPPDREAFAALIDAGHAWVVATQDDIAIAYVTLIAFTESTHVQQLSVHPDGARRRLGADLLDHVAVWSSERGVRRLTLTTFRDVPWNAPYYARLGFRVLAPRQLPPHLRAIREREAALGLDAWPRVAMSRK